MKEYNKKKSNKAVGLLFYVYIILLCYFLFFSEHYGRDFILKEYRYNLEFLKEIKRFIRYRELIGLESFVVNILGNVLAFAPFGFLLPHLNVKYRNFFYIAFLSMIFSLTVELTQMLLKVGIFDVDDILLNTIGGILGYLFYAICASMIRRQRLKNKKQRRS